MSANSTYTIETRAQGALVLCDSLSLTTQISQKFISLGIDCLQDLTHLDSFLETHDLDYIVIILSPNLVTWITGEGGGVWDQILLLAATSVFVVAQRQGDTLALSLPSSTRHLVLGEYLDLEGGGAPTLSRLLSEANTHNTLTLAGDGIIDYSLLSLADLSAAIFTIATSPTWEDDSLLLANPETISLLSLAHTIANVSSRNIKIKFTDTLNFGKEPGKPNWAKIITQHARYGLVFSGNIKAELNHALRQAQSPTISPLPPPLTPTKPKLTPLLKTQDFVAEPPSKSKGLVFVPLAKPLHAWKLSARPRSTHPLRHIIFRGLAIALGLYLGSLAFVTTIVGLHLASLTKLIDSGNLTSFHVSPLTKFSATYLEANLVAVTSISPLKNLSLANETVQLMSLYTQGLSSLSTAEKLADSAQNITSYILTDKGGDIAASFSSARLYSEELYERLSYLDGSLSPKVPPLIKSHEAAYLKFKTTLATMRKNLATGKALLAIAPDFIALGGRTKYLVLFQNNMELRATGGFIGSFALVSFENGRLYDLSVYDVYAADGQLKGHVEPPPAIKEILGEANWYLRDSNFDPDFPTSARRAEWFIQKTMGTDVQGTIAITLDLLKSLLAATGPLDLPDYNETITTSNIYERAQYHAEVNFFPGSQAKKEFLSSVADALFTKLKNSSGGDTLKLVLALAQAVDSKNILVSVLDPGVEHVLSTLSWNGQLLSRPCPGNTECIKDYAFLVDSNFGVNKANYYITRDLKMTATISKEGTLAHSFTARYKNSATSSAWPAGPYKNYARLYLPLGSKIDSVVIGDKQLTDQDITITQEHNNLVVAFLLTVPINQEIELRAQYTTPELLKSGSTYTWYWQKQPGTPATESLGFTLNYPLYLKPELVSPTADLTPQQLYFGFQNDTDHRVTIKFAP